MKLRHVTIFTAKFEESLKFYQEITGLVLLEDMRPMLGRNLLFLGNAAGETMVELVEVDEAGAYTGSGISMGFVVDDAEKYREELLGKGMEATPIISPNPFTKFFSTKDPNGVAVQFLSQTR